MATERLFGLTVLAAMCLSMAQAAQTAASQQAPDITYLGVDKMVAECRPVVVSIEQEVAPGQYAKLGTGCLVNPQDPVVLTCKHVVEAARAEGPLAVGINTKEGKMVVSVHVVSTSERPDLALLKAEKILEPPPRWTGTFDELLGSQRVMGFTTFAADSEIAEGTGTLMIGFPLGLGNEVDENHPVSRLGIVAQGVYTQSRFLVDADASRGNSGSPIFLCSTGKFAGIVFAQAADTISIIDDANQKVARMPYGASLAACIPASAIRKFLEAR